MKNLAIICVLVAMVSVVTPASATMVAEVDYTVEYTATGTFDVYATVAPGNGGLAYFYLRFGDETTSLVNESPQEAVWDGSNYGTIMQIGFSQARGPDAFYPNDLCGGQNPTLEPGFMVYGVGQLPGPTAWPNPLPGGYVYMAGIPAGIGAPVLLGSGTFEGVEPTVLEASANVFVDDAGSTSARAAECFVDVVPEPMTMTLLAIGGLALIRRRRA